MAQVMPEQDKHGFGTPVTVISQVDAFVGTAPVGMGGQIEEWDKHGHYVYVRYHNGLCIWTFPFALTVNQPRGNT